MYCSFVFSFGLLKGVWENSRFGGKEAKPFPRKVSFTSENGIFVDRKPANWENVLSISALRVGGTRIPCTPLAVPMKCARIDCRSTPHAAGIENGTTLLLNLNCKQLQWFTPSSFSVFWFFTSRATFSRIWIELPLCAGLIVNQQTVNKLIAY